MPKPLKHTSTINLAERVTRRRRWRPWMTWTVSILGALVVFLGITALYYYPKASAAISVAKRTVTVAKKIPTAISAQEFSAASTDVADTLTGIRDLQQSMGTMRGLRAWPYVGQQYAAVEKLLTVGDQSVQAVGTLVTFLEEVFAPFAGRGKVSLAKITPAEKGAILGNISARGDELRAAQEKVQLAKADLDTIKDRGLWPQLGDAVRQLKEQFPTITEALDQAIPATKVFPTILGYPKSKNYLFLLENNTELRPGGGFIGTYGFMKVESGEIVTLQTENVYTLDNAASKLAPIKAPLPLVKYLKVDRWSFRDSNWSPDFPTSAAQALYMYKYEGGHKDIDGVIAVTPTAIAHLIGLVGAIKVDGIEFTEENFVDTLEYQVEKGFLRAGIDAKDRKDIISDLTSVLMNRLLNLPLAEWGDLFTIINNDLEGKQVLIWLDDPVVQNIMIAQNWAGTMDQRTDIDSLMVVDANLASLKTDRVLQRTYSYKVEPDGDGLKATLKITYKNNGAFDWRTTRYNTYVRVYVPAGSTLLESRGAQLREKSNAAGKVETLDELGKTVFGAFKSTEPGASSDLELVYRLPSSVVDRWKAGQYLLAWQKQPGMLAPDYALTVKTPTQAKTLTGVDSGATIRQDAATITGHLNKDVTVAVTY